MVSRTSCEELPWETIPDLLKDRFRISSEREALVHDDTRLTYGQLGERVQQVAAALRSYGVSRGDIVFFWAPNSWQWVVSALATWWLGAIVVPVSSRLRAMEVLPILRLTGPRVLMTSSAANGIDLPASLHEFLAGTGESMDTALPSVRAVVDLDSGQSGHGQIAWAELQAWCSDGPLPESVAVDPHSCSMVLFTSGTTGQSKGVERSHYQVLRSRWQSSKTRGFNETDRLLVISPFSHVSGLNNGLLRCVLSAMTHVVVRHYTASRALELIAAESISALNGPPSLFQQLLVEQNSRGSVLANLRFASTGSASIPPEIIRRLQDQGIQHVCASYGLTECEAICETRAEDDPEVVANSVGRPAAGFQLKLVDDQDSSVAAGEVGEILVRGFSVMLGYYRDPEATRAVLDDDGWLRTGDMGRIRPDGNLQIVGRKKEMIITQGINIYPAEIENQLMQSELLDQVAVVGQPSRLAGEEAIAFIVPREPVEFKLVQLVEYARTNMAIYKQPSRYVLCDNLPLNANGKVDKCKLRESKRQ